jgi:preprotein translocase subunit YajC
MAGTMELRTFILQQPAESPAAPPQGDAPQGGPGMLLQMLPFVAIFVIFYFLLIKPQRRQQKDREAMLTQIKKNDHVVTSGGIIGIVDKIKDDEVVLKIDEKSDVRLRVTRAAIADIRKMSGAAEEKSEAGSEKK